MPTAKVTNSTYNIELRVEVASRPINKYPLSVSDAFVSGKVNKLSLKSKSVAPGCIELNYEVRLKDADTEFINALAKLPGVNHTVMVSYNGDYMS